MGTSQELSCGLILASTSFVHNEQHDINNTAEMVCSVRAGTAVDSIQGARSQG